MLTRLTSTWPILRMLPVRRAFALAGVALLVFTAAVLVLRGQLASAAKPEPWPNFTMVYQDTRVTGGVSATQTFRLTYVDRHHFTTTLLAHSAIPEAVGWTHTVNGANSTTTDPRLGTVQSATFQPGEVTVPDDWLVPGPKPQISYRNGATIAALPGGFLRVRHTQSIRIHEVVEEVTYRELDGIPTQFIQVVDGKETRRVEVLELTLSK